jgi:hypothetical protein
MKKFVGEGCRGWKMAEGVVSVVTRGDSGCVSHEGYELLEIVDPGTRRQSRIGSLCQFLHEPQGFLAHG